MKQEAYYITGLLIGGVLIVGVGLITGGIRWNDFESGRIARDTIPDLRPAVVLFEDETISIPNGYKFLDFKRDNGSVSILTREAEGDEGLETYYIIESNGTQTRKIFVVEGQ